MAAAAPPTQPATTEPEPQPAPVPAPPAISPAAKPIHSLVLDTGPLIKNDPPASVLLAKAERLYTLPCIVSEIRDPATRSRVETTLLPFVTVRTPKPESLRFVAGFAKKTGDYAVLSRPDLEVLALGYELECERNGGDWRLRNTPGQKTLNGRPPQQDKQQSAEEVKEEKAETEDQGTNEAANPESNNDVQNGEANETQHQSATAPPVLENELQNLSLEAPKIEEDQTAAPQIEGGEKAEEAVAQEQQAEEPKEDENNDDDDDDDDEGGWITPSNLKKHQSKDSASAGTGQAPQRTLQAAILTSDYAMQNVALRINLNLVTPSLARITYLKTWVLRCHGCFTVTRDMNKQFCPKCGQPTLTRTSCSTDERGNFTLHLKRNFQWNNRGNVYSVPKPVHGSSNGRLPKNVGGKNGWGRDLILAEDQKEHVKALDEQRRTRKKDIMDDDFLPGILSGDRSTPGSKVRVGAGRTINSRRKR